MVHFDEEKETGVNNIRDLPPDVKAILGTAMERETLMIDVDWFVKVLSPVVEAMKRLETEFSSICDILPNFVNLILKLARVGADLCP